MKKILDKINSPKDLKKLTLKDLNFFSRELRDFVIETVSQTGGHFGSNLGVIELTIALHYVFNTPEDLLIWDVGHQAYSHKIITGRKDKIKTIRKKDGLAPFPKREESEFDAFGVGHSATSISVATGMAMSKKNKKKRIIAVIGDGALTGGMALEALNHAGDINANVIVILNDNKMSISPNVGGISKYLIRVISSPAYRHLRERGRRILKKTPSVEKFACKIEKQAKGLVFPGTLFEELGFEYYGPIDGHNIKELVGVLDNLKNATGPKFLHIITKKGKGYEMAEKDDLSLHAVKPFDPITGVNAKSKKKFITYTEVFSDWICDKAKNDKRLQAITPAMCEGSGLKKFSIKFPNRYFDVGIAEQHAVTFAGGLSCSGEKPVVAIYSSFFQRAYDQFIHDIALQDMDVLFAVDRAGIVGPDGATHAGSFDLTFARAIPGVIIMAPSNENECYAMLEMGYNYKGPAIVRYPRGGSGIKKHNKGKGVFLEFGKSKILRKGKKVAILSFGALTNICKRVAKNIDATLIDMRFVKPLDEKMLISLAKNHSYFFTVEDNTIVGGAGSGVNEFVLSKELSVKIKNLGLPDKFLSHGTREEVLEEAGLNEEGIESFIKKTIVKNK